MHNFMTVLITPSPLPHMIFAMNEKDFYKLFFIQSDRRLTASVS